MYGSRIGLGSGSSTRLRRLGDTTRFRVGGTGIDVRGMVLHARGARLGAIRRAGLGPGFSTRLGVRGVRPDVCRGLELSAELGHCRGLWGDATGCCVHGGGMGPLMATAGTSNIIR